ncbi:MAG: BtpA/SgcQ family protein [Bacteroidales bacterium]|nr:BtpA/SgcQ family protein [Bacteroidales bacterium]
MSQKKAFKKQLAQHKIIIGMIHLEAMPGTPKNTQNPQYIINKALEEAKTYAQNGIEAVMIENMHDVPYLNKTVGDEVATLTAIIAYEIKRKTGLYCGIQILAGANKAALAAAHSAVADFIRVEGFVFAHIADEGYIESSAAELLRYRKLIGADDILIFTDIKKKHSAHAISSDISIAETAEAAEFFLSDGVILTGSSTGKKADINELKAVKNTVKLPVLIGSGITDKNIAEFYPYADAFIIGSYFKEKGNWQNAPDPKRIKRLLHTIQLLS